MIEERRCSYEVCKLLHEKGFDVKCTDWYWENNINIWKPTHQMAMKWLREVYNLQIIIIPIRPRSTQQHKSWTFEIYKNFNPLDVDIFTFPTYEEDCEAALKYVLEKLIKL